MMNILIVGKNGQLGYELQQNMPSNLTVAVVGSAELDVTDEKKVENYFSVFKPEVVINASAYTAVDKAESDSESAYAVNFQGCKNIAKYCKKHTAKLIHVSTDFVFDGSKNTPYMPNDITSPLGVYGESKLAGEEIIREVLPSEHVIIRTSWVYSVHGNNFVKTMLRLMADKEQLSVVYDQVGTPTWAKGLADTIWLLVKQNELIKGGIYHWADAGITSWYDFAVAIQELAFNKQILNKKISISPIPASEYPTPAKRPSYSVLDKSDIEKLLDIKSIHWHSQLNQMLDLMCSE